jgi:hypothetical protein
MEACGLGKLVERERAWGVTGRRQGKRVAITVGAMFEISILDYLSSKGGSFDWIQVGLVWRQQA